MLLINRSKAALAPGTPSSLRIELTTDAALDTTAGARDSASAMRAMLLASRNSAPLFARIRSRCFFGGTGSSKTMSKRRMKAGSKSSMAFVTHSVGTEFPSSIRFIQALRVCAVLFGPNNPPPSLNTSSTSSKRMRDRLCARKHCAARKARKRASPVMGSPSSSSPVISKSSHSVRWASTLGNWLFPLPGAP